MTWRSDKGLIVGTASVTIPARGVVYRDARVATDRSVVAGSVEIAHDGEPQAIVGSQTTLSVTTGLSFDTLFFQRRQK